MFKPDANKLLAKLHYAVWQTKPDDARKALAGGADPHAEYRHPQRYYNGNVFHAHAALRHTAYGATDYELVDVLRDSGADINAANARGERPLHVAAKVTEKQKAGAKCMADLLSRGADANRTDAEGKTALYHLCSDNTSDQAVLMQYAITLVNAGARVNAPDGDSVTPLMRAAGAGHAELYSYLVLNGADVHATDNKGHRASDYAASGNHYALHDLIRSKEAFAPAKPVAAAALKPATSPDVVWEKLSDHKIAKVTMEEGIHYRITEIFNFRANTYLCVTQNLYTKAEAVTVRPLDEMADTRLLKDAKAALENRGGATPEAKVFGAKPQTNFKFPKS